MSPRPRSRIAATLLFPTAALLGSLAGPGHCDVDPDGDGNVAEQLRQYQNDGIQEIPEGGTVPRIPSDPTSSPRERPVLPPPRERCP